jgi:hypothetical protein
MQYIITIVVGLGYLVVFTQIFLGSHFYQELLKKNHKINILNKTSL